MSRNSFFLIGDKLSEQGGVMTLHAEQDVVELVYSLRQQNADLVAALEEIEAFGREAVSTRAKHMGNCASGALAKAGKDE